MGLFYLILAVPVVIFWALAALPPGAALTWVQRMVMALLGFLWIGYLLGQPPLRTGDTATDGFVFLALLVYTVAAVSGAATGAVGRRVAERVPALRYPLVAAAMFVVTFAPILTLLGV